MSGVALTSCCAPIISQSLGRVARTNVHLKQETSRRSEIVHKKCRRRVRCLCRRSCHRRRDTLTLTLNRGGGGASSGGDFARGEGLSRGHERTRRPTLRVRRRRGARLEARSACSAVGGRGAALRSSSEEDHGRHRDAQTSRQAIGQVLRHGLRLLGLVSVWWLLFVVVFVFCFSLLLLLLFFFLCCCCGGGGVVLWWCSGVERNFRKKMVVAKLGLADKKSTWGSCVPPDLRGGLAKLGYANKFTGVVSARGLGLSAGSSMHHEKIDAAADAHLTREAASLEPVFRFRELIGDVHLRHSRRRKKKSVFHQGRQRDFLLLLGGNWFDILISVSKSQ